MDKGNACGVLFLDLAKAFDTVDHDILLYKLKHLGFRNSAITWFDSYFCNRNQVTIANNHMSDMLPVLCGVPQGSILGPLLFICYINDLSSHLALSKNYLYADDTALVFSSNNTTSLSLNMNTELCTIDRWFRANKLTINADKTYSMLIRNPHSFRGSNELLIVLKYAEIQQTTDFKYLGVIIDEYLTFNKHVKKLKGKIAQRTGLLWRIRKYIHQELATYL